MLNKIGLGGGCHWCTEAIFQSLLGVEKVAQGWISAREAADFSEAVIVHYDAAILPLEVLIEIHLYTHSCTSNHTMRHKYRSAVYVFSEPQKERVAAMLQQLQPQFKEAIITRPITFQEFKENSATYLNYYQRDPNKPFCKNVIAPKLRLLLKNYRKRVDSTKINGPDKKA